MSFMEREGATATDYNEPEAWKPPTMWEMFTEDVRDDVALFKWCVRYPDVFWGLLKESVRESANEVIDKMHGGVGPHHSGNGKI